MQLKYDIENWNNIPVLIAPTINNYIDFDSEESKESNK